MLKQGALGGYFKPDTGTTRDLIFRLLTKADDPFTLDSLLAEANGVQICELVAVFRETRYWQKFLVALLRLSPEVWDLHAIFPEYLQTRFTLAEKREILKIDSEMLTDGRQSPLLSFLKFERLR